MESENLSLLIRLSVSDGQKTDSSKDVSFIGPYGTMLSVVMALCLRKFTILNDVRSLSRIFLSEFYET